MDIIIAVLPYLVAIAVGATAMILIAGIVAMASEGEFHEKYSNLLMRARVAVQGAAVALLALLALLIWLTGT
jgi:hypothetical protein